MALELLLLPFSNNQTVRYITIATQEIKEALGEMAILQNKRAKRGTITNQVIHQTIKVITKGLTRITTSDQRHDKKKRWNNSDNSHQSQYNSTLNHGYSNQPVRNGNA